MLNLYQYNQLRQVLPRCRGYVDSNTTSNIIRAIVNDFEDVAEIAEIDVKNLHKKTLNPV